MGGMPGGMGGGMGGGMPGGMGGLFGSLFDEGPMGHGAAGHGSDDDMMWQGQGKRPRQPVKHEIELRVRLEDLYRWAAGGVGWGWLGCTACLLRIALGGAGGGACFSAWAHVVLVQLARLLACCSSTLPTKARGPSLLPDATVQHAD
jgi:hypothetical protein